LNFKVANKASMVEGVASRAAETPSRRRRDALRPSTPSMRSSL
jgi:hypothetical protein